MAFRPVSRNPQPSPFPFTNIARGGTAPGPPNRSITIATRPPNSSHKYGVQAMNYASVNGTALHKMTLKGKGWRGNGQVRQHQKTRSVQYGLGTSDELKRPKSIKTRLHSLDCELSDEEKPKPPVRTFDEEERPPSRHKTPPKATGLELPPWPITPPDSTKMEMTWSHNLAPEESGMTTPQKKPLKAYRPITTNAWERENPDLPRIATGSGSYKNGRKLPETSTTTPKRRTPKSSFVKQLSEAMPPTVGSKRALSAYRVSRVRTPKSPSTRSAKSSTVSFKSSLDPDFLDMFNNY